MPKPSHISGIMDRVRAASSKNPEREWRSFPARKGRPGRDALESRRLPVFGADLSVEDGVAAFSIRNRTGHVERVVILGTEPGVIIDIDGNQSHSASLPVGAESTTVEIRRHDRGGELLAAIDLSAPQELPDEHEAPDTSQQLPEGEPGRL